MAQHEAARKLVAELSGFDERTRDALTTLSIEDAIDGRPSEIRRYIGVAADSILDGRQISNPRVRRFVGKALAAIAAGEDPRIALCLIKVNKANKGGQEANLPQREWSIFFDALDEMRSGKNVGEAMDAAGEKDHISGVAARRIFDRVLKKVRSTPSAK